MEETSIVWSTESLFPDLHPTVVDTSHSRTLDASTCLRILLIPRSILFSVQPKSLRYLSSSFPFRRKPRRDFQRARSTFVTKFIHRMNHRPMNNLDANRFQLGFPFSTWDLFAWIRGNGIATEHFRIARKNWPVHVRQSSRFACWTSTIALDCCTREIDQPLRNGERCDKLFELFGAKHLSNRKRFFETQNCNRKTKEPLIPYTKKEKEKW